jgi:hypothetical protein
VWHFVGFVEVPKIYESLVSLPDVALLNRRKTAPVGFELSFTAVVKTLPDVGWFFKRVLEAYFQVLMINQAFTPLQLQTTWDFAAGYVESLVAKVWVGPNRVFE